ncbi:integrase [Clostridium pascui]|uniref:site-specific integrase n=1 Tax=Clostridium pascui TaxID=46609 RepID=UPI00195615FC|nr:site-specific integrase [Clostridium pascui]MBM7869342.1 integrase [Clostridium pascui]
MDYNVTWRKKDKGWQCIISYKDSTGKWKQKSKQGFKTQKDGKPYIDKTVKELESTVKNNININDNEKTFEEVTKMYLEHSILYKEYNTVESYKNTFSKFSNLNDEKIKDIKKYDVQKVVDCFIKEGLKFSTIETYLRRLNVFFKYVRDDLNLIVELPTTNIKIPKDKDKVDKKALNKKDLKILLRSLKGSKFYIVAFIAANTGMRLGEILGLTWSDLDEINLTLDVNKQWKISKENKKSSFGDLKGKNSYRIIPISNNTLKELKNYRKNYPTDIYNRIAPFNVASIDKYLNPKLRELAGISIHELRHTYATTLISNGVDFKTAAKLLGHDVKQTMKTYSHVNDDMMKKATSIIENVF